MKRTCVLSFLIAVSITVSSFAVNYPSNPSTGKYTPGMADNSTFELSYWIHASLPTSTSRYLWGPDYQRSDMPTEDQVKNAADLLAGVYGANKLYLIYHREIPIDEAKTVFKWWRKYAPADVELVPTFLLNSFNAERTQVYTDEMLLDLCPFFKTNINPLRAAVYQNIDNAQQLEILAKQYPQGMVGVGQQPSQAIPDYYVGAVQDTWGAIACGKTNDYWQTLPNGKALMAEWFQERNSGDKPVSWDLISVAWDYLVTELGTNPGYDDAAKNMALPAGRNTLVAKLAFEVTDPDVMAGFSSDLYILHANSTHILRDGKVDAFYETLKRGEVYKGYFSTPLLEIASIYRDLKRARLSYTNASYRDWPIENFENYTDSTELTQSWIVDTNLAQFDASLETDPANVYHGSRSLKVEYSDGPGHGQLIMDVTRDGNGIDLSKYKSIVTHWKGLAGNTGNAYFWVLSGDGNYYAMHCFETNQTDWTEIEIPIAEVQSLYAADWTDVRKFIIDIEFQSSAGCYWVDSIYAKAPEYVAYSDNPVSLDTSVLSFADADGVDSAMCADIFFSSDRSLVESLSDSVKTHIASGDFNIPASLERNQDYYWCVRQFDYDGSELVSPVWKFRTVGQSIKPVPVDGIESVSPILNLGWQKPDGSISQKLYISTDKNAVEAGVNPVDCGSETSYSVVLGLAKKYYWRVDQVYSDGIVAGDVWSFTTAGGAEEFCPLSGEVDVSPCTQISWRKNAIVDHSKVYFSDSVEDITKRNQQTMYNTSSDSIELPLLDLGRKFYWLVAEYDASDNLISESEILSFKTVGSILIDDFQSYETSSELLANWNQKYALTPYLFAEEDGIKSFGLKLKYSKGYISRQMPGTAGTKSYLEFRYKGSLSNTLGSLYVKFLDDQQSEVGSVKINASAYGLTNENWQNVILPIGDFGDAEDFSRIQFYVERQAGVTGIIDLKVDDISLIGPKITSYSRSDFNRDGYVDIHDLAIFSLEFAGGMNPAAQIEDFESFEDDDAVISVWAIPYYKGDGVLSISLAQNQGVGGSKALKYSFEAGQVEDMQHLIRSWFIGRDMSGYDKFTFKYKVLSSNNPALTFQCYLLNMDNQNVGVATIDNFTACDGNWHDIVIDMSASGLSKNVQFFAGYFYGLSEGDQAEILFDDFRLSPTISDYDGGNSTDMQDLVTFAGDWLTSTWLD